MRSFVLLTLIGLLQKEVIGANVRVDPLVHIDQGLVRGEKSIDGDYSTFKGIPYAQVDEDNPFGPALPAPHLQGIFNAYDASVKCPQISRDGSDVGTLDCLRLNVYVPKEASSRNPLPVLVWIHGGGFGAGSAGEFNPTTLMKTGIVVVTINYRLGPYGFMCLDNPAVPGNQGLKDQYAAIQWVRNNIRFFGGNPYDVTLGGESAGSASVLYHLFSSKDKLYTKVIAQSDTPYGEGMFAQKDVAAANKIASHLGFDTSDTNKALEFLSRSTPSLVVGASRELNLELKPCKEQSFENVDSILTTDPFSMTNVKKVKGTPILIGHTTKEHKGVLFEMYGKDYLNRNPFYEKIKNHFSFDEQEVITLSNIVRHFYIGDNDLTEDLISTLEDFDSDFVFAYPVQRAVTNLLAQNAEAVYQYLFSFSEDSSSEGVGHASENKFLFDDSDLQSNEDNQLMVKRMTSLWSNFIKYGNPTQETTELLPVIWKPAGLNKRPYLVLDTNMRMENRVYSKRMAFWDLVYKAYEKNNV